MHSSQSPAYSNKTKARRKEVERMTLFMKMVLKLRTKSFNISLMSAKTSPTSSEEIDCLFNQQVAPLVNDIALISLN